MEIKSHDLILLTGAGFTKNFGGFLASEIWANIFNHPLVQGSDFLRELLMNDFDYESVYSAVVENTHVSEDDKNRMRTVLLEAYRQLDDATRGWVFNDDSPYPVCWYTLMDLIGCFSGTGDKKGFFFTLNQDLFMERRCNYRCPGVPPFPSSFYSLHGRELESSEFVTLPRNNAAERAEKEIEGMSGIVYIKLHGSFGWKTSDGVDQLVVGKNKTELIKREPLMQWYLDLFKSVIQQGNKKLLLIGYGFRDQHINEVLLDGVQNHGLKIFVFTTSSPQSLKQRFEKEGHYYALPILKGIHGYFPYSFKDVFPSNQDKTVYLQNIKNALLKP